MQALRLAARARRLHAQAWWCAHIHLHLDLKNFPVYLNGKARDHAAMREVRGAYRQRGGGLGRGYTKAPKHLRFNPGAKSVMIAAAVGKGRVRLWETIDSQWSGAAASTLYRGPLARCLKRVYPDQSPFRVLEDNDPVGFRSTKGIEAKRACKISVFEIPRRSPDLNVCDYALWRMVIRAMRAEEATWAKGRRETREAYIARLRKTALGLPASSVRRAIGDMKRRCARLFEAGGGLFEEGGADSEA